MMASARLCGPIVVSVCLGPMFKAIVLLAADPLAPGKMVIILYRCVVLLTVSLSTWFMGMPAWEYLI